MNPFPYAFDNKRYHTLAYHNRVRNCKTQKASIDAGFSCPNIDGRCGYGGCLFCDGGSGYFTGKPGEPISVQIQKETERIRKKHPTDPIIAYFQAHSNTYAPVKHLSALYREAISCKVQELSIATRPDCLTEDILQLLRTLQQEIPITVELGLQTTNDVSAERFNRGYSYAVFQNAFLRLRDCGVRICVHIINGLPGETEADMLETASQLGALRPDGIKIHLLHVIRGTRLAALYEKGRYTPMTMEAYIRTVIGQLERLPMKTVIERITGDGDKTKLLAPAWSRDKIRVLGTIDQEMARQNTWQGRLSSEDACIFPETSV